jgi:hypothetical protein
MAFNIILREYRSSKRQQSMVGSISPDLLKYHSQTNRLNKKRLDRLIPTMRSRGEEHVDCLVAA